MREADTIRKMNQSEVVAILFSSLLTKRGNALFSPQKKQSMAFAPINIALCKYWGKRDNILNLPMTNSLSIALADRGAFTTITADASKDTVILNQQELSPDDPFVIRLLQFISLFRTPHSGYFHFDIRMTIPVAAGFASSAAGFASLILALNDLFDWQLPLQTLSILARLGSGSAARSFWNGFVEWQAGVRADGMDSYAVPLAATWPALRVGLLSICPDKKTISSRDAMRRTVETSTLYGSWPKKVSYDLALIKKAIEKRHFPLLAGTAESNALSMHATMLGSWPPICYFYPETIAAMQRIWALRQEGLLLYFTQDAGPNLKLLFEEQDESVVRTHFPTVDILSVS